MKVVYSYCSGLEVHQKSITVCVLWAETKGKSRKQKKRFPGVARVTAWSEEMQ